MADKLSESLWTAFTKKNKLELDDGPLVKALSRFDKSDSSKPAARLEALKEVVEQAKKQVVALSKQKKALGDKPFNQAKDQLYQLIDLAETQQRDVQNSAADDDGEGDSPVLLTTKMLPLVREIRKGGVTMHAMVCTASRQTSVLIMRKPISSAKRKLLSEALGSPSGAKFIVGEVLLENKALTFVMQSAAAGLAKRLHQALLEQLQLRLKVRVRGDDGAEDLDGEDEDSPRPPESTTIPDAPPQPGTGPNPAQVRYEAHLAEVSERVAQALKAQHPEATKIRALLGFAQEKASTKKDFSAAEQALDVLDKLLKTPVRPQGAGQPGGRAEAALADWQARRATALAALKAVATQIAAAKHPSSAKAILEIQAVMKNLTEKPASAQQVTDLRNWLGADDVVQDVCDLTEDIRTPLMQSLSQLQAAMAA